ncbi:ATP-binding protein [bacterium SCSIO 12741]|nr:ATP-binding protein [bacterium SCSIO 12741]
MKKTISFSSVPENLDIVERFVTNICDFEEIDERFFGNILIALTEGATNAINHGNNADPEKEVVLQYDIDGSRLKFVIQDQGNGFDYENIPDPTLPENLEKVNGRGIFLIRNLSDELEFKDQGKVMEITFNLNEQPA